jgi:chaperonin cofactor prefoldin
MQYSNFKDTLQNIASQIGNVEQEVEEHKYVMMALNVICFQTACDIPFIWQS